MSDAGVGIGRHAWIRARLAGVPRVRLARMIAHIREGRYGRNDTLVFVHTGGMPAILTCNNLRV